MLADDAAMRNVVAYIGSLPDTRPAAQRAAAIPNAAQAVRDLLGVSRREGRGHLGHERAAPVEHERLVHGAPAAEFPQGIRGTHPQDFHGAQMARWRASLTDDEAITDLLDYVHDALSDVEVTDTTRVRLS